MRNLELEEKIMKGNCAIAKFMGGKFDHETNIPLEEHEIWLPAHGICRFNSIKLGVGRILEYHMSWNWLVPVCGSISDICEEPEELDELRMALLCADIDTAWKECVDWITNYNKLNE